MRSTADSIRRTMKLAQRRKVPFGREENVAEMLALRIDSNIRPPGFHRIELNWRAD